MSSIEITAEAAIEVLQKQTNNISLSNCIVTGNFELSYLNHSTLIFDAVEFRKDFKINFEIKSIVLKNTKIYGEVSLGNNLSTQIFTQNRPNAKNVEFGYLAIHGGRAINDTGEKKRDWKITEIFPADKEMESYLCLDQTWADEIYIRNISITKAIIPICRKKLSIENYWEPNNKMKLEIKYPSSTYPKRTMASFISVGSDYDEVFKREIFIPILQLNAIDFQQVTWDCNIDFAIDNEKEKSRFINCSNLSKINFDQKSTPKESIAHKKRHLLRQIGLILERDKYIPEAEAVFDEEMKVYAEILETKVQPSKNLPIDTKIFNFIKKIALFMKNIFNKPWSKSDYLVLKFSDWFSDFGKSLWRPFGLVPVVFITYYIMTLLGFDGYNGWKNGFSCSNIPSFLESFIGFLNPFSITKDIEFHKEFAENWHSPFWESIRIIALGLLYFLGKLAIGYMIYNFIRATRRFNRS